MIYDLDLAVKSRDPGQKNAQFGLFEKFQSGDPIDLLSKFQHTNNLVEFVKFRLIRVG